MNFQSKKEALEDFSKAMKTLRDEGILTNKKDFTCQIGEWLVEMLFDGKRANSAIQKGWDVDVKGKHVQVKSHAKAETNAARFTEVVKNSTERIDELIIVVFTFDYKLKVFYQVPWEDAFPNIKLRGKKKPRDVINWSSIKNFKIETEKLPHPEIISLFK